MVSFARASAALLFLLSLSTIHAQSEQIKTSSSLTWIKNHKKTVVTAAAIVIIAPLAYWKRDVLGAQLGRVWNKITTFSLVRKKAQPKSTLEVIKETATTNLARAWNKTADTAAATAAMATLLLEKITSTESKQSVKVFFTRAANTIATKASTATTAVIEAKSQFVENYQNLTMSANSYAYPVEDSFSGLQHVMITQSKISPVVGAGD